MQGAASSLDEIEVLDVIRTDSKQVTIDLVHPAVLPALLEIKLTANKLETLLAPGA